MENNLDKLFKSKLEGQDPDFHPAAWDRMEAILDEEGMTPSEKDRPRRGVVIYLSFFLLGILIATIGFNLFDAPNDFEAGSTLVQSENTVQNQPSNDKILENKNLHLTKNNSSSTLSKPTTTAAIETNNHSQSPLFEKIDEVHDINADLMSEPSVESQQEFESPGEVLKQRTTADIANAENLVTVISPNLQTSDEEMSKTELLVNPIGQNQKIMGNEEIGENKLANGEIVELGTLEDGASIIAPLEKDQNDEAQGETELLQRSILEGWPFLSTQTSDLEAPERLITPQVSIHNPSKGIQMGIQASIRSNEGVGYAVGPYMSFGIGHGLGMNLGAMLDVQNFGSGPEITVTDKIYSFGSTLIDRTFTLGNQQSLRIPISIEKSFGPVRLLTGMAVRKEFATGGMISESGVEGGGESATISSEMIRPWTFSFQLGTVVEINRYFDIDLGIDYRPGVVSEDPTVTTQKSKIYPSIGLRYKLFKF